MTSEATTAQIPDVYGQLHPVETVDLIERKRTEFEQELEKLSTNVKTSLSQAEEKCPGLVTEDFKLKFLRCEVFNADVSRNNDPLLFLLYFRVDSSRGFYCNSFSCSILILLFT
jgi:hypothetical protein